jgi:hypothetical protein
MKQLDRRVQRLEKMAGLKLEPRFIYFAPNLEEDEGDETPYFVKVSSEVWVDVFGGRLCSEEIKKVKEEFRNLNDCKT